MRSPTAVGGWLGAYRENNLLQIFRIEHTMIKNQPWYPDDKTGRRGRSPTAVGGGLGENEKGWGIFPALHNTIW